MISSYASRDALETALMRSFVEGTGWPIDRAALAALSDMGMGADEIAAHFAVDPREVRRLIEAS